MIPHAHQCLQARMYRCTAAHKGSLLQLINTMQATAADSAWALEHSSEQAHMVPLTGRCSARACEMMSCTRLACIRCVELVQACTMRPQGGSSPSAYRVRHQRQSTPGGQAATLGRAAGKEPCHSTSSVAEGGQLVQILACHQAGMQ